MKINPKKIIKITLFSIVSILGLLVLFLIFAYFYSNNIVKKTGKDVPYFFKTAISAYKQNPYKDTKAINFLILGLDKRDDLLEKNENTDTIILASVNTENSKINLISFPRDLWNYDLKMKINGIYPLSIKENKSFDFLQTEYQKIFDQEINKTVVITTNNLIDLVNTIGGVDVYLEKGFKDEQYPNQAYINNPKSDAPIYKTVEFSTGSNHLDQSNITEFVRSRKGIDVTGQEVTDVGRILRQQLLIESIMAKIRSKDFIENSSNIVNLYNFWHKDISTNITDFDIIALGLKLKSKINLLSINKINIPIGNTPKEGLIYHPEITNFTKQWIYVPSKPNDYSQIQDFIKNSLN